MGDFLKRFAFWQKHRTWKEKGLARGRTSVTKEGAKLFGHNAVAEPEASLTIKVTRARDGSVEEYTA
jgi:hypothetical protein